MRWDELFDDIAGQGAAADAAELAGEVVERARLEIGRMSLAERLRGWPGHAPVALGLHGGLEPVGVLVAVGLDWLALDEQPGECLVPLTSIRWIKAAGRTRQAPVDPDPPRLVQGGVASGLVRDRLGLTYAFRCLARDRATVRVLLVGGETVFGTVDAAGLDHVQLAQHSPDEPRRRSSVQASWTLPFTAIAAVCGGQVWSGS